MNLKQPLPGKMPHLKGLGGKVALGLARGDRSWPWQFLGIFLLAAVVGSPARLAGEGYQETSPSAKVQNAWLTASVSDAGTTASASPVITFVQPPEVTVGTSVTLSASVSPPDGLPVLFSAATPSVCTVASPTVPTVTTITVGTCTITAYQDGDPPPAASVTQSFQVQAAAPTITFVQPPEVTVGTSVTLSASVSPPDGLPVLFSAATPSVCTVASPTVPTVTTIAVGTCAIVTYQDGQPPRAAPKVSRSFQVSPVRAGSAAQTITFGQPPGVKVGARVTLSASASSGLPVSFRSATPSVCTVAGRTVTSIVAGPCTITASQGGNARYAAAPDVSRSFQVSPVRAGSAAQTITFGQPPGVKVGARVTLSASASSGLPVSFRSATPSVCTVAGRTVTSIVAGPCTITASQGGNARYAAAPDVSRSFQVSPVRAGSAAQTITFGQPPGVKVGARVTLSASASSGLPVSFRSATPSVCTVAGRTVTSIVAGPCTITASQGGNARYAAAPDVSRSFQVSPVTPGAAGTRIIVLGAIILAAAAAALVVRRRPWLHSHPPTAPGPSVRAVPHTGPPGLVSVHATGTDTTHTVHIEPSPGASITTIEEARP